VFLPQDFTVAVILFAKESAKIIGYDVKRMR
jgi:hypothetical protein